MNRSNHISTIYIYISLSLSLLVHGHKWPKKILGPLGFHRTNSLSFLVFVFLAKTTASKGLELGQIAPTNELNPSGFAKKKP